MEQSADQIFADLDGTLIRTDLFYEAVLQFVKQNPLNIFLVFAWLLKGRPFVKEKVAQAIELNVESLPYETELIDYLKEQRAQGRQVILATAAHHSYAEKIADFLGFFDAVIATRAGVNMKGARKLAAIQDFAGERRFTYAGDSSADRPIWKCARSNIFVNAPMRDVRASEAGGKAEKHIQSRPAVLRAFIREMRIHQYAKNALVLVPLFTSHSYQSLSAVITALIAFLSFSICASGVYFLNDLLDVQADRKHPRKCKRPLASGDLSIPVGVIGALGLPLVAFVLAIVFLPWLFVAVLAGYYLLTNIYSFYLKRVSTADVMTLAVLYTLRVVAGGAALGISLSSWLMGFSIFAFVSLAYLKRYVEVAGLADGVDKAAGRGYGAEDKEAMFSLGVANMSASVLVLALYINSEVVSGIYNSPQLLWLLCLLMLYWGNRLWIGARRDKIADDPVVFAIRDRVSQCVGICFILVTLLARYLTF
ncbi:UbiA family prenyltransferase [Aestuariispira ectoiniformans]|uniref:UbiA family prenyltransferase n=1 Tax=Aestuariispira ectoiniformans TaxID=2775080 RepID=UPI00223AC29D|nr:UbiA family prenyltransferase [Aestuariispira ectoiniformans]